MLTTLGFHAERKAGTARAPQNPSGAGSAQFTVNVMYVTGQITGTVTRDTATLTGTAEITGLGAGSNVPFTFVVHGRWSRFRCRAHDRGLISTRV